MPQIVVVLSRSCLPNKKGARFCSPDGQVREDSVNGADSLTGLAQVHLDALPEGVSFGLLDLHLDHCWGDPTVNGYVRQGEMFLWVIHILSWYCKFTAA